MDPLSDVLSLLKPQSIASGGFELMADTSIRWPEHVGIKCYAVVSGECWLTVDNVAEPVLLTTGDCYLLPPGPPFRLATNQTMPSVDYLDFLAGGNLCTGQTSASVGMSCYIVGGHFILTGCNADILLKSLPPIVHIQNDSDKAAMRWSLQRMKEEVTDPQPGSSLIAQQLAYMMLVQALRLHLTGQPNSGVGWLFALADKQISAAITCMHDDPSYPWTLQKLADRINMSRSVFAQRFKETVGTTPMEYLTRWRMLLAGDRLKNSDDTISEIAISVGYESDSAFGKAFKRIQGRSPRQHGRVDSSAIGS